MIWALVAPSESSPISWDNYCIKKQLYSKNRIGKHRNMADDLMYEIRFWSIVLDVSPFEWLSAAKNPKSETVQKFTLGEKAICWFDLEPCFVLEIGINFIKLRYFFRYQKFLFNFFHLSLISLTHHFFVESPQFPKDFFPLVILYFCIGYIWDPISHPEVSSNLINKFFSLIFLRTCLWTI